MSFEDFLKRVDSYKQIDEGGHRAVFDIGNGLVLKKAIDVHTDLADSKAVNISEYNLYQQAEDKGYLCPALWVSKDGMYLIMKNANVLAKPATKQSVDEFILYLVSLGNEEYDLNSPANWVGHYLVDYGLPFN